MAEFNDVIKDWIRMCRVYLKDISQGAFSGFSCEGCPVYRTLDKETCKCPMFRLEWTSVGNALDDRAVRSEIEQEVTRWAEEYPPVYPTWGEWLKSIGIWDTPDMPLTEEIAEKLGIEKTGVQMTRNEVDAIKRTKESYHER